MINQYYDKIIVGAGLYGLYAAKFCADKGQSVLVLEYEGEPFSRATYINQARVHMGYHYPRSLTTAVKSAGYFRRFEEDYKFCIHDSFEQVYATSNNFSWTSAQQFQEFCKAAGIRCEEISPSKYFKKSVCDGAFLTEEYTYDARILQKYYEEQLDNRSSVTVLYNVRINKIIKSGNTFQVCTGGKECFETSFLLNAAYASVNQVIDKLEGMEKEFFPVKYELCEIILCRPAEKLKDTGITVMDGPFFSIMPFGKTGLHSLTAVTFTPHVTSYETKPEFSCQQNTECSPDNLNNCNTCPHRPDSAWHYMSRLADKYMRAEYGYTYAQSLYSMKPILKSSEVDDSRPTAIKLLSQNPTFLSVLSGKINTVYDLDEYLQEGNTGKDGR